MSKTETNVDNLKINYLTKKQYDEALASGSINLNEVYVTPEEEEQDASPVTTAGTGSEYTATVQHIKTLNAGVSFTMIPHTVSTSQSPTLNVNNFGAKQIRQRLSNNTQSTVTGSEPSWLAAGKPVHVAYDGMFWIVDFVRPNMTSAYGVLPIENGGTGATTAEQARENLGISQQILLTAESAIEGCTVGGDIDVVNCVSDNNKVIIIATLTLANPPSSIDRGTTIARIKAKNKTLTKGFCHFSTPGDMLTILPLPDSDGYIKIMAATDINTYSNKIWTILGSVEF